MLNILVLSLLIYVDMGLLLGDSEVGSGNTAPPTTNLTSSIKFIHRYYQIMETVLVNKSEKATRHFCSANEGSIKCCSCNNSCLKYGICCFDNELPDPLVNVRYHCSPIFEPRLLNQIAGSTSDNYMMISQCSSTARSKNANISTGEEIGKDVKVAINNDIRKCLSSEYESMAESIPVLSTKGDVYRSASCARCNGLREFTSLNVRLSWKGEKNDFERDLNNRSCKFQLQKRFEDLACKYDQLSYPVSPGRLADYFCYKCSAGLNGDDLESVEDFIIRGGKLSACENTIQTGGSTLSFGWSIILDFSGKISIQGYSEPSKRIQLRCEAGHIYNIFTQKCSGGRKPLDPPSKNDGLARYITIDYYITIVGSSISIMGYLLVVLTYSKFKVLQNVPGLSKLAMAICLLLAYLTFLFRKVHCKFLAFFSHYFLLVSQMWVVIICIDLAVAIHSSVAIKTSRNKVKTLSKYLAIACAFPLPFAGTPVILNETGQIKVGYQSETCWINHFETRLWSFIVPTGFVYLLAISSLISTFQKIYRIRQETKGILESNQRNVSLVQMALKMTLGLGIIDTIGFVQISGNKQTKLNFGLAIAFTAVMSFKGVFVCALYLVNVKVFNLYKRWFKKSIDTNSNSIELKLTRRSYQSSTIG